jgi:hypothetical protein
MQHWVFGSPHFKTFHKKGYIIRADTQGTPFIQWPVSFSQKCSQCKSSSKPLLNTCEISTLHKISLWPRIFIRNSWNNFLLHCKRKISEKWKCNKWQIFHDIVTNNSAQSVWQFIPFHKCDKVPYLQLFLQLKKKDFIMQKHLSTVHWSSCPEI